MSTYYRKAEIPSPTRSPLQATRAPPSFLSLSLSFSLVALFVEHTASDICSYTWEMLQNECYGGFLVHFNTFFFENQISLTHPYAIV